jgi:hypothetical protein
MPPGWTQQWDQNSQRWFYIEQATGRTQWDPPSNLPPGPYAPPGPNAPYVAGAGHDERGLFGNTHGHSGHDYNTAPGAPADPYKPEKEKKDKGHSTAMLAAAGIGGIAAGAWIGHELSTIILSVTDSRPYTDKQQPRTPMTRSTRATPHPPPPLHPPPLPRPRTPRLLLLLIPTPTTRTAIRPSRSLLQFPPTMRMVAPFQAVTVNRLRRSARSSLRRRKSIKRSLRRHTRTESSVSTTALVSLTVVCPSLDA